MRAGSAAVVVALVVFAAALGAVVARVSMQPEVREVTVPVVVREKASPAPESPPAPEPARGAPREAPTSARSAADRLRALVPDASQAHLDDADTRARRIRAAAQQVADSAEQTAARQVADEIAKERAFLADRERGGTMALLRAVKGSGAHPFDLVGSPERFGALFVRSTTGPALDGKSPKLNQELADGATITFPAGVHSWSVSQLGRGKPFPKDLLVLGAGMDSTILKIDEFNADGEVASLTFRDLTIDCSNNYMTDLRSSDPVTLRLERCRVIGFDMGAGGSVMLSASGGAAFFATDSRFEAGFSRTEAGHGNLFRVHGGLLVRMQGCTIVGPFRTVFEPGADATYDFVDSTFTNIARNFAESLAAPPEGVRFENCRSLDANAATVASARVAFLASVSMASRGTTDLFTLLAAYKQSMAPLVEDRVAFAAFFEPRAAGPTVDGASQTLSGPAPAAATVVFPAGAVEWTQTQRLPGFQGDLALTGQGMDTTLVRLRGDLQCGLLTLRDITIDLGQGGLPRDSRRACAIRMERCRVIGFDGGSGDVFGAAGPLAVFAEDSRIEAGFGRSPSSGSLFRGGGATAARFERCTIRVPYGTICDPRDESSAVAFIACRLVDVNPRSRAMFEKPPAGLVLTSCSVEYGTSEKPGPDKPRSLAEINPSWDEKRR